MICKTLLALWIGSMDPIVSSGDPLRFPSERCAGASRLKNSRRNQRTKLRNNIRNFKYMKLRLKVGRQWMIFKPLYRKFKIYKPPNMVYFVLWFIHECNVNSLCFKMCYEVDSIKVHVCLSAVQSTDRFAEYCCV